MAEFDRWDAKIGRAILGARSRRPLYPQSPAGAARSIEARWAVGAREAARRLGVPWSTYSGWRSGRVKRIPDTLLRGFRRAQLSRKREDALRRGAATGRDKKKRVQSDGLVLKTATFRVSDKDVEQNANVSLTVAEDTGRNAVSELIDAYLTGEPGAMTATMESILDDYGAGFGLQEVLDIGDIHL